MLYSMLYQVNEPYPPLLWLFKSCSFCYC